MNTKLIAAFGIALVIATMSTVSAIPYSTQEIRDYYEIEYPVVDHVRGGSNVYAAPDHTDYFTTAAYQSINYVEYTIAAIAALKEGGK